MNEDDPINLVAISRVPLALKTVPKTLAGLIPIFRMTRMLGEHAWQKQRITQQYGLDRDPH